MAAQKVLVVLISGFLADSDERRAAQQQVQISQKQRRIPQSVESALYLLPLTRRARTLVLRTIGHAALSLKGRGVRAG
jgi:hypothetical protein